MEVLIWLFKRRRIQRWQRTSTNAFKGCVTMHINCTDYVPLIQNSQVYGRVLTQKEISALVSKLECKKAIAIATRLFALNEAYLSKESSASWFMWFLFQSYCKHIQARGGNVETCLHEAVFCPQTLFQFEKVALSNCIEAGPILAITLPEIMLVFDVLIAINDHLPQEEVENHKVEYLYLTLYHNTHKIMKSQIGRSYYIFNDIMSRLECTREFSLDFAAKKGYTITDYFAVLFGMLICFPTTYSDPAAFVAQNLVIDNENFNAKGLAEVYAQVIEDISKPRRYFKQRCKERINKYWDFETFYRFPAIKFRDTIIPASPITINYAFWEGLYWNVRYIYSGDDVRYLREFGRPFETYIQEITEQTCRNSSGDALFYNEFEYQYQGKPIRSSDAYIRIGDTIIAIEAKAKSPLADTFTSYCLEQCKAETSDLLVAPVHQIDQRISEILSGDAVFPQPSASHFFSDVHSIVALSVSMEKVQPVGELMQYSDSLLRGDGESKLNCDKICCYHNLSIEDFEAVCNLIEQQPFKILEIMVDWFSSLRSDPLNIIPLANYLAEHELPYCCPPEVSQLFSDAMCALSMRVFGRDVTSRP